MLWVNLATTGPTGPVNTYYGLDTLAFLAVAASQMSRVSVLVPPRWERAAGWVVRVSVIALACGGSVIGLISGRLPGGAPTAREAVHAMALDVNGITTARWLREHAARGLILVDDRSFNDLPETGIDLHRVVAPFSQGWSSTLESPGNVTWVVVDPANPSDAVYRTLSGDHALGTLFWPVAEFAASGSGSEFVVYENGNLAGGTSAFSFEQAGNTFAGMGSR